MSRRREQPRVQPEEDHQQGKRQRRPPADPDAAPARQHQQRQHRHPGPAAPGIGVARPARVVETEGPGDAPVPGHGLQRDAQQLGDPRRRFQPGAGQHHHRGLPGLMCPRRAAWRRPPRPGRRSARHRGRSAPARAGRGRSPLPTAAPRRPGSARSAPSIPREAHRLGDRGALGDGRLHPGRGRRPERSRGDRRAILRLRREEARQPRRSARPAAAREKPMSQPSTFDPAPQGMMTLSGARKPRSSHNS